MKKYRKYKDFHRINSDNVEEKKCKDCLNWFELNHENFGIDNKNKDKFNVRCKQCQKEYNEHYYVKNKIHIIEKVKQYQENNFDKLSEIKKQNYQSDEAKERIYQNGVRSHQKNPELYQGLTSNWRKNHKDKTRQYSRDWQLNKEHEITKEELKELYEYCNYSCMYCGMTEEEAKKKYNKRLFRDHFVNDGANTIDNCILCCNGCSSSKRDKTFEDWYTPKNPRYSQERYNKIIEWINKFNK